MWQTGGRHRGRDQEIERCLTFLSLDTSVLKFFFYNVYYRNTQRLLILLHFIREKFSINVKFCFTDKPYLFCFIFLYENCKTCSLSSHSSSDKFVSLGGHPNFTIHTEGGVFRSGLRSGNTHLIRKNVVARTLYIMEWF